jgi:putative membrane protein
MAPLDARARTLAAASARRVALVTAVSPRALVDIGFVVWESVRLGGAIARLYGARPGLWSSWRLVGAILGHLAVTGGLVLTDGVIEQLVGQGLAARLSQRLGEGVVNGLMTVRVGIAAMRVVRPLPFNTEPQPMVKDFLPELANVLKANEKP